MILHSVKRFRNIEKCIINQQCFHINTAASTIDFQDHILPHKAKVVICGGGVLGNSVAYHLAEKGWGPGTVILEKTK